MLDKKPLMNECAHCEEKLIIKNRKRDEDEYHLF